ncbi:hypothetical protein P20480_3817 [Pseudoalteromonas sp. BSi20480]|jgi:hypothetical protein|nr:hypothetical protein [Pseudoalteromonas sp. BSi20480]GAA77320.1 hypothetical protein P20480_3817 [Pseudoalteromonas sp. BSi20480]|tara:strand:- start:7415 stop:7855 length:441 start_codon:yes stop_codon:yes gene_type:complete
MIIHKSNTFYIFSRVRAIWCNAIKPLFSFIFGVLIPITVNAQTRGGTCQNDICEFTGGLIGLALLVIFFISLSASIAKHGFWKGVFEHTAVRILIVYFAMITGLIFAMLLAVEVFGKLGGILLFLAIAFMPKSWIKGIKEDDKKNS